MIEIQKKKHDKKVHAMDFAKVVRFPTLYKSSEKIKVNNEKYLKYKAGKKQKAVINAIHTRKMIAKRRQLNKLKKVK